MFDVVSPEPKLKSFKEAIQYLEDCRIFLEHHGCFEQASTATSLVSDLASCHAKSLTQSTLDQFFVKNP